MKERSQGRLPDHDPLLVKMAATKRGFSSVEPGSRATAIDRNPSRRRSPMRIIRSNAIRIKRFRKLEETLRTKRDRLLVGLDIAQGEHVAHLRHAHTRVVTAELVIPNTTRGFAQLWARIQQAQRATGCREVVCGLEPTATYHEALAHFLDGQGADVVLVSSAVAYWNRRTQDGTWDKHDRKDAANCADLLEQGKVLFYRQPDGPLTELRRLVKCLRRARAELAACKARWRTTLRPALGPVGEPLPGRLRAELPAVLQAWEPGAPRCPRGACPSAWPRPVAISARRSRPCRPALRRLSSRSRPWPSSSLPTRSSGASPGSAPRWRRSSWPRSATSRGTRSSASSGSSRASTSCGCSRGSSPGRRGSRRPAGGSCAGRCTTRPCNGGRNGGRR